MSDSQALIHTFQDLSQIRGYEPCQYGSLGDKPLIGYTRGARTTPSRGHLYLSSGIHGDEPAGIQSLLALLNEDDSELSKWDLTICPVINPSGLDANTRENHEGRDLNRDFQNPQSREISALCAFIDSRPAIDLSLCLHEDWESTGFYLYYLGTQSPDLAQAAIKAIEQVGPIEPASEIDGREAENGIIHPPTPFNPFDRDEWPEAFYLYQKNPHPHFTLESPSSLGMAIRVGLTLAAIRSILANITLPQNQH